MLQQVAILFALPIVTCLYKVPYSRKYWRELNLVVGSQIAIANVLADLNLAVRYGIAIHIYAGKKFWRILIWWLLEQTAKPPNLIPRQIFRLYRIGQIRRVHVANKIHDHVIGCN